MLNDVNRILKISENYLDACEDFVKIAFIRKLPNGKYRVLSEKGRNLGTYDSKSGAKKRLQQIEYFKHLDHGKAEDKKSTKEDLLDLTDLLEFSYSAFMRELRRKATEKQVHLFLSIYKKEFDIAVEKDLQKPEKIALQNAIIQFSKTNKLKLKKEIVKNAAVSELGNPAAVGKYLANIVKFTLTRISPERRGKSISNLKQRFYNFNEKELASKKMPASSAIGQSITFVKTVLFNHDPKYIREVINHLIRYL